MNRDFMMMLGNMFGRKDNQGFSQSSMQELAQRLQTEKDFILLDVRTHEEFDEGHIPGAICISEASCPDKICVGQGYISNSLVPITCLPHKLVIELRADNAASDLDAISH